MITADHGNCDQMQDGTGPHTAHTLNPVPLILVDDLRPHLGLTPGILGDIAPTLLALMGILLEQSFGRATTPDVRFDRRELPCPRCGATMGEGYLPLLAPLHGREPGQPVGLPTVFTGLPGTVGWSGRPRVHADRCASCEVVTLRYGKPGAS